MRLDAGGISLHLLFKFGMLPELGSHIPHQLINGDKANLSLSESLMHICDFFFLNDCIKMGSEAQAQW